MKALRAVGIEWSTADLGRVNPDYLFFKVK